MKIYAAATFKADELKDFAMPPNWRKATRNMIMATASIQRTLGQVPQLAVAGEDKIGFVLGSCSGELETSAEFLATWAKSQMARPVLFQNSLHNATTGFASIQFKLTGPSFTVSGDGRTPEESLDVAISLLREGLVDTCLVTLVECHKSLANVLGFSAVGEGACTFLVGRDGLNLPVRGKVPTNLSYQSKPSQRPLIDILAADWFRTVESGS